MRFQLVSRVRRMLKRFSRELICSVRSIMNKTIKLTFTNTGKTEIPNLKMTNLMHRIDDFLRNRSIEKGTIFISRYLKKHWGLNVEN